jgi:BspA type Leucine rich repeat region (6 copies)
MSSELQYTYNDSNSTAAVTTGNYASLTVVTIPSTVDNNGNTYSVTSIGDRVFKGYTGLTSVSIPNSVTSIGLEAFNTCTSLTTITIPINVTTIGTGAFGRCTNLTTIDVDQNNTNFTSTNGVLFNKNKTTILKYPQGKTQITYTIPDSVTVIDLGVFSFCTSLTYMAIPSSITSIGISAFNGCTNLANVYFYQTANLPNILNINSFLNNASGNTAYYKSGVLAPDGSDPAAYLQSKGFANRTEGIPNIICFKENSKILSLVEDCETEIEIQNIKIGDLVKTHLHGYKKVIITGQGKICNSGDDNRIKDRLYKYTKENYPELTEDLVITGGHSILVDELSEEQKERTKEYWKIFHKTDDKYRLLSVVDEKSIPYEQSGTFNIYHIVLEHVDETANYGIYANGLLVESCTERSLKKTKNMTLTE